MHRLLVNPDTPDAWAIDLQPGSISLGRGDDNDFSIEHPSVSSKHCRITVRDGGIWLNDLGSTAGTFLDGELVEDARLKSGQLIRLGEVAMRLESAALEGTFQVPGNPPLAPRITPLPASIVSGYCKFHPQTPGRFVCGKCARTYCDLCVTTRSGHGAAGQYCRQCGSECQPIQPQAASLEAAPPGFVASLPRAFLYPFQGSGVILLVAGTVFFFILGHLPLLGLLITGYLFSYAKSIITSTTQGRSELPDWPDFGDWKDDIIVPYVQLLALVVLSFGPSFLIAAWQRWHGTDLRVAYYAAVGVGALLAPMGMLALAMFDSIEVLNPLALVWTIGRVPMQYLVAAAAFEMVLVCHWFIEGAIESVVVVPVLPGLLSGFLYLYFISVGMRILGLLYLNHRDDFGWFSRLQR